MSYIKPSDNPNLIPLSDVKNITYPINVQVYIDGYDNHEKSNYINMLGLKHNKRNINDIRFRTFTILGEISNMLGHYVVVNADGKIISGLHSDLFYVEKDSLPSSSNGVKIKLIDDITGISFTYSQQSCENGKVTYQVHSDENKVSKEHFEIASKVLKEIDENTSNVEMAVCYYNRLLIESTPIF